MRRYPLLVVAWLAALSLSAEAYEARPLQSSLQYWASRPVGWFIAAQMDAGLLFFRPRGHFGYGQAHYRWIGIEANPLIASEAVGAWFGLRAMLPNVNLRLGGRYQLAFSRSFLAPEESYTREDIEIRDDTRSRYLSLEAELTYGWQLGPGTFFGEIAGTYITGVDQGKYVYEETVRAVVDPPWVWRWRNGYALSFLKDRRLRVGLAVEVVHSVKRFTWTLRAGGIVRFAITSRTELRGTFIPVFYAHDPLGLAGADSYQIGLRHLWGKTL